MRRFALIRRTSFFQTPWKKWIVNSEDLIMTTINLSQYQKLPFSCITRLYFVLYALGALHLPRGLYKSTLFMQNKPNFPKDKKNVNNVLTRDYENENAFGLTENKPNFCEKQTQSKPIKPKTCDSNAKIYLPIRPISPNFICPAFDNPADNSNWMIRYYLQGLKNGDNRQK